MIYLLFIISISTLVSSRPADHSSSNQKQLNQNLPGQLTMAIIGKPNTVLKFPANIYHKRYGTPNYQVGNPQHEYSDSIFKSLGDSFDKLKNIEKKENMNFIYEFPSLVSEFIRAKKLEELKKNEKSGEKVGQVFKSLERSEDRAEEIMGKPEIDIIYTNPGDTILKNDYDSLDIQKEDPLFKNKDDKVGLGQKEIQEYFNLLKRQHDYKQNSEEGSSPNLSKGSNFAPMIKNTLSPKDFNLLNIHNLLKMKQDYEKTSSKQEHFSSKSPPDPSKRSKIGSSNENIQLFKGLDQINIYNLLKMKQDYEKFALEKNLETLPKEIDLSDHSKRSNGNKYDGLKLENVVKQSYADFEAGNLRHEKERPTSSNGINLQTLFDELNGFKNNEKGFLEQSESNGDVFKSTLKAENHKELANYASKSGGEYGKIFRDLSKEEIAKVYDQLKKNQESTYHFDPITSFSNGKPSNYYKRMHGDSNLDKYEGNFHTKDVQNDQSENFSKGISKDFFKTVISKVKTDEYEPFHEASNIFDQLKGDKLREEDFKYLNTGPNGEKANGKSVQNVFEILKNIKDDKTIADDSYENEQPSELIHSKHIIYGSDPTDTPTFPIIKKHVYVHVAPPDSEEEKDKPKEKPVEKHYKIIFIKTPNQKLPTPSIPTLPEKQEKTLVYVLVKKPEVPHASSEISLPAALPTLPSKPEVYYIRYMDKEKSKGDFGKGGSDILDLGFGKGDDRRGYEVEEKS